MAKRKSRKTKYTRKKQLQVLARGLAVLATGIAQEISEENKEAQIKKLEESDDSDD